MFGLPSQRVIGDLIKTFRNFFRKLNFFFKAYLALAILKALGALPINGIYKNTIMERSIA
jgi:hypothetical protein